MNLRPPQTMASTQKTHLLSRDFEWFLSSEDQQHQVFQAGVISSFDGVHHQHLALLKQAIAATADHDPCKVLLLVLDAPDQELISLEERVFLIRHLVSDQFAFARIDGDPTKGNHIMQKEQLTLALRHVDLLVPGMDVLEDQSSVNALRKLASSLKTPLQMPENSSSCHDDTSIIKDAVARGEVTQANRLLGYAYALEGLVVKGNMIGRTLGYPTANLKPLNPGKVIPGQGVYAGMAHLEGEWHPAMINIGIRPTLDLEHVTIEAHLLDYQGDLYGTEISFHFLERLRDEMRFSSLSHLKEQLKADRQATEARLKELRTQYAPSDRWLMMTQSL